jgi:HEAT repeat protein
MARAKAVPIVKAIVKKEKFNLANSVGVAIIGLLVSLVGTGVVSMIALYTRQATLTEQVTATSAALAKHLDHSVDRDEYLRRDAAIQRTIDNMATKEELRDLRNSMESQTQMLRDVQTTLNSPSHRR